LRTLTLHLPTNLPPPSHLEVILRGLQLGKSKSESFENFYAWRSLHFVGIASVWLTPLTRNQRARLSTVLGATRNTSPNPDQPSLFACLLSSLNPHHRFSLRHSARLDNGSYVVLLRIQGLDTRRDSHFQGVHRRNPPRVLGPVSLACEGTECLSNETACRSRSGFSGAAILFAAHLLPCWPHHANRHLRYS
jgi:hypothetical protein